MHFCCIFHRHRTAGAHESHNRCCFRSNAVCHGQHCSPVPHGIHRICSNAAWYVPPFPHFVFVTIWAGVVLSVSSQSIVSQPLPIQMVFTAASTVAPGASVLTVKPSSPCASLSAVTLSSGFSLCTVGSAVSFDVVASDGYGNLVPVWPADTLQTLHSKVRARSRVFPPFQCH
jgi:hypothetical protein